MAGTLPLAATTGASLRIPQDAHALVLVAQSGSDTSVLTQTLEQARLAIVPVVLTGTERLDTTAKVQRLTEHLVAIAEWIAGHPELRRIRTGIYGSGYAAGAALAAAAFRPDIVRALVLRNGRPAMAGAMVTDVRAATLLIVNGHDEATVAIGQDTMTRVNGIAELEVLLESPLADDNPEIAAHVARLARRWFGRFLA